MVGLVALLEPAQDGDRVVHAGLAHEDLLEAALQGGVLLDVLAVLVQGGRADQAQLAAGQHGLEHVAGVHGALGRARAHDGVDLVDERDDLPLGGLDLLEDGLQALLELAAVLGAGDHGAQVQADQRLAAQGLGDVPGHHPLGQALDDGGLADAGLADEHGVVLGAAREHLHHTADLGVAADHRVELAGAGDLGEVRAVLLQGLEGGLRVLGGDAGVAAHQGQGGGERLEARPVRAQCLTGLAGVRCHAEQQVLGGDELVRALLGLGARVLHDLQGGARELGLGHRAALGGGQASDGRGGRRGDGVGVGPGGLQDGHGDGLPLVHQGLQQVGRLDLGVAGGGGVHGRSRERLLALGGELGIHGLLAPSLPCPGVSDNRRPRAVPAADEVESI